MSHLLQAAIAAHGGVDRWNSYRKVSLDLSRGAFKEHQNDTPRDLLHAAYFDGYALWTYLTKPFLYPRGPDNRKISEPLPRLDRY
jgi:hypothetical protein